MGSLARIVPQVMNQGMLTQQPSFGGKNSYMMAQPTVQPYNLGKNSYMLAQPNRGMFSSSLGNALLQMGSPQWMQGITGSGVTGFRDATGNPVFLPVA